MSRLQDAADRIRAGGFGDDLDLLESRVEKTLDNFKALTARCATLEAALRRAEAAAREFNGTGRLICGICRSDAIPDPQPHTKDCYFAALTPTQEPQG